jgi:iron complex outermembrane receptor protein
MKKMLGTIAGCFFFFSVLAQYTVKGNVSHQQSQKPIESVTIQLIDGQKIYQYITKADGYFEFKKLKPGNYQLIAQHVSMKTVRQKLALTQNSTSINIAMEENAFFLEPLEVKSIRAADRSPFAKTNIGKAELNKINLGQDLPFLLNQTPSVVVNSDAGNGVGYTGIRIRGSDATRINMTINGIPYNDAESQGLFLVNLPDLASSVNSIQLQRGVGTSSNGAGAFGATLNLSTNEFNEQAYAELNNSVGSFNTRKHTIKAGTGVLNKYFTADVRLSQISSDGFIDRAASKLQSFYFSPAYTTDKTSIRLNIISGKEKTYQAWYGIPETSLRNNRTFNSAGTAKPGNPYENETDNYQQDHLQFFVNHAINNRWAFNTALFYTKGKGYYEQYRNNERYSRYGLPNLVVGTTTITRSDFIRQLWLDNDFYGQTFSIQNKNPKQHFTLGGGWNRYDGQHFGKIIWADKGGVPEGFKWYDFGALKTDINLYSKWQQRLGKYVDVFVDVQYRNVYYRMDGFRDNPSLPVKRTFNFFNPKAGITYTKNNWNAFLSFAVGNKEPNRDDFEAGLTQQPLHETLHDIELGVEQRNGSNMWSANFFFMNYKNQLVLTGKVNDVGAYTRTNIPESYRLGVELQGVKTLNRWMKLQGNLTLSENKVKNFIGFIDDYDNGGQIAKNYGKQDIAFSPAVTGAGTITLLPFKDAEIGLMSKYVSRQYMDNTGNKGSSLNPFFVQDLRLGYTIAAKWCKALVVTGMVNNVLNKQYEPNGYTFSYLSGGTVATENFYYPMAGTNVMLGLNIKL